MMLLQDRRAAIVGAVFIPCLVAIAVTILKEEWRSVMPRHFDELLFISGCVAGFALLRRAYRQHAIWLAILYFPIMLVLQWYAAVTIITVVYHGP